MADVVLRAVSKSFGGAPVLDRLDLEVRDGELMVLVGPSGCGKSTALRLVAGLEEVTSGTIAIGGRVVNDVAPKDRDVAMVFQSYALYPHMTVRQNLEFGLELRRTPRAERERLVADAARTLGLEPLLGRRPKELSGGQRQRVALGRALVREPAVFLFDEPLSNLDAKLRVQMRAEIKRLQARLGTTAIYVTHDQVEAMTMGHRIAVLHDGRLEQVGPPLELYDRPATVFVAGFLGSPPMNLVRGRLAGNGARVVAAALELPLPPSLRAVAPDGREVVAGIRPEHLAVGDRAPGGAAAVALTVDLAEPLGDEVVVHARAGPDPLVLRHPARPVPASGDRLVVTVDVERLHLFDATTGRRLGG